MTKPGFPTIFVACLVLVGCHQGVTQTGAGSSSNVSSQTQTAAPQLPDSLKSDAYHWYGLANDKPISFEVSVQNGTTYTGTQTVTLQSVKDGNAEFKVERSGELEQFLGTETIELSPSGVYTVSSTLIKGNLHNLEMPADLNPGKTWKNTGKFSMQDDQNFAQDETLKVVDTRSVTTKAGTEQALYVTGEGTVTIDKKPYRMQASYWYVKDRGMVKNVITMVNTSDKKAKPQVITIQQTK